MMKKLLMQLTMAWCAVLAMTAQPHKAPTVIFSQPEGTLRVYERHGYTVRENTQKYDADTDSYAIDVAQQDGVMNMVFAGNGDVYLQDPVSNYIMASSWVKGTLSADGQTITLPLDQYVDYTRSFDMAYQLKVLVYSDEARTYVVDSTATEVTYRIDGSNIALQGTSQQRVLGLIIRTFGNPQGSAIGQDFSYLNGEWTGDGDFESVYTPSDLQEQQPPAGLETETLHLTTALYDGAGYTSYDELVRLGFDGDNAWLQGLSRYVPSSWVTGVRSGNKVVFHSGQFMGSSAGVPLYLMAAAVDSEGHTTLKDLELTYADGRYTTFDYAVVSTSAHALNYVCYYMGLTLAPEADAVVTPPADMATEPYVMAYTASDDETGASVPVSRTVQLGFSADALYVQGIWEGLPQAWVQGRVADGVVTFALPQYLGNYYDEESGSTYTMYLTAFDAQTGQLLPSLTFRHDAAAATLTGASAAISIGVNKTGYLSVLDCFDPTLTSEAALAVNAARQQTDGMETYNLQGQRVNPQARRGNVVLERVHKADGTVSVTKRLGR